MRRATAPKCGGMRPFRRGSTRAALVGILVEAVERLRAGERPEPDVYIDRHPHLREEILRQLAVLDLLEGGHMEVAVASAGALGWGNARKRLLGRRTRDQRGS